MRDKVVHSRPFPMWSSALALTDEREIPAGRKILTTSGCRAIRRARKSILSAGGMLFVAIVWGLLNPSELTAQTAATTSGAATSADPAATSPLGRYVSKDNLVAYFEFAGLDSRAESWHNTAAFKMLTETPLGEMLEIVSGQLLDRALIAIPDRRLNGSEIVKLAKAAAKSGWVIAVHTGPKDAELGVTIVLRGAVTKDLKPLSSRLMGWMMGAQKYKIEQKGSGRTLVVVPSMDPQAGGEGSTRSLVWWPEKNDLVIASPYPAEADRIIASLDGKATSAVDHPIVQELKKLEGPFEPVCVAFADVAGIPDVPSALTEVVRQIREGEGVQRVDFRWGFDGDALMSVTKVVAPKPWKSMLAVFEQPTFEKTSLMPKPESVDSFVELSLSPSKLLDSLENLGGWGAEIKAQIDEMSESIKAAGSIDLKKDVLGHLGPRMVAYLGAGQSAATGDDSLEAVLKNGFTTTGAVTALQSFFPKLTLVAGVDNPEAFAKGLDTAINAINSELKAQAIEKAAEKEAATEKTAPGAAGGAGRPPGNRSEKGGDRTKRRRPKETTYPHFQTTIGQANTQATAHTVRSFIMMTPSDSPLRFGPSSFRPTILLEDKYVAFAMSSDAAKAAIAAAKRKDWKPSSELERACEKVPSNLVMLSVSDVSESLSSVLASLPGTLQTMINTSIALAKMPPGGLTPDTNAGAPPSGSAPGSAMMRRGGSGRPGSEGMPPPGGAGAGRPGFGPPGGSAAGRGPGAAASATDAMIVLNVDPEKLPKSTDLKPRIFPTTVSISVADGEIRFVSRRAFPDISGPIRLVPAAGMMPGLQSLLQPPQPGQPSTEAPAAAEASAAAGAPEATKGMQPPGGPGRRGGRRGPG